MEDCKDLDILSVTTTVGSVADARALAGAILERRLAACVQVEEGLVSVYRWQGEVQQEAEEQMVIKTTADRLADLEARLRQLHSYELPEFLVISADASSEAYLKWVGASTHEVSERRV